MEIWLDADTCPPVTREILCRAVEHGHVPLNLVTDRKLRIFDSRYIRYVELAPGQDEPGKHIVLHCQADDLVVTADIALAADVIARGSYALDPKGNLIGRDNISYHRVTHDLKNTSDSDEAATELPVLLSQQERENFTNQLDRILHRVIA